jgi:hypothetical protein
MIIHLRFDVARVVREFMPSIEWALVHGVLTEAEASDLVVDEIVESLVVEESA